MDAKLQEIMERANRIGTLFPKLEDIDPNDPVQAAEIEIVLAEFAEAERAMWLRIEELKKQ